jgi:Ca-activated chloride channel family protein
MIMQSVIQISSSWNQTYYPFWGAEKAFLLVELKGNASSKVERTPMNLCLVLDRSGSMEGSPLHYSKKACQFVVDQMGSQDLLSMVAFDDEITTVFQPQGVTHKDVMKSQIEKIQSGGSTNLSGGLLKGIQHVMQHKKEGMVNRVILLSDGHANAGITDREKLNAIATEFRTAGIGITTMGVGNGFDEEMLEGIADHGSGNFYYIEKADDIPTIFAKELEGLCAIVAQNVQLSLNLKENATLTHLFGYKAADVNGKLTLTLADLFDQEVKSILLEFALQPHNNGEITLLELEWSYMDVTEGAKVCTLVQEIQAKFTNDINLLQQPHNTHVEKQVKITESAMVIEEAILAFDQGDNEKGKRMLQQQADQMLVMAVQSDDAELREESQVLYNQLENFTYTDQIRKTLHEQKYRQMKRKKM